MRPSTWKAPQRRCPGHWLQVLALWLRAAQLSEPPRPLLRSIVTPRWREVSGISHVVIPILSTDRTLRRASAWHSHSLSVERTSPTTEKLLMGGGGMNCSSCRSSRLTHKARRAATRETRRARSRLARQRFRHSNLPGLHCRLGLVIVTSNLGTGAKCD